LLLFILSFLCIVAPAPTSAANSASVVASGGVTISPLTTASLAAHNSYSRGNPYYLAPSAIPGSSHQMTAAGYPFHHPFPSLISPRMAAAAATASHHFPVHPYYQMIDPRTINGATARAGYPPYAVTLASPSVFPAVSALPVTEEASNIPAPAATTVYPATAASVSSRSPTAAAASSSSVLPVIPPSVISNNASAVFPHHAFPHPPAAATTTPISPLFPVEFLSLNPYSPYAVPSYWPHHLLPPNAVNAVAATIDPATAAYLPPGYLPHYPLSTSSSSSSVPPEYQNHFQHHPYAFPPIPTTAPVVTVLPALSSSSPLNHASAATSPSNRTKNVSPTAMDETKDNSSSGHRNSPVNSNNNSSKTDNEDKST
jgi:hypothetical protein